MSEQPHRGLTHRVARSLECCKVASCREGGDYQLAIGDALTLDARYLLELEDGELVMVRNCGAVGALVPTFEARVDGPYAWLNATTMSVQIQTRRPISAGSS
jgi:hypothetical protein